MNREFEQYEHQRQMLQIETNKNCIDPMSFEVYKKTDVERTQLANAKSQWKTAMRKPLWCRMEKV